MPLINRSAFDVSGGDGRPVASGRSLPWCSEILLEGRIPERRREALQKGLLSRIVPDAQLVVTKSPPQPAVSRRRTAGRAGTLNGRSACKHDVPLTEDELRSSFVLLDYLDDYRKDLRPSSKSASPVPRPPAEYVPEHSPPAASGCWRPMCSFARRHRQPVRQLKARRCRQHTTPPRPSPARRWYIETERPAGQAFGTPAIELPADRPG